MAFAWLSGKLHSRHSAAVAAAIARIDYCGLGELAAATARSHLARPVLASFIRAGSSRL